MTTFAIANNKGGVGKTTAAVNLGAAFAKKGHKTLLIDLDPQGNASVHLGIEPYTLPKTMREVLLGSEEIQNAITPTDIKNLDLVPSNLRLDDFEMSGAPGKEMALAVALDTLANQYAYVLIDCPPRLGLFTTCALVAAHHIIIPIQVAHFALEGTSQVLWAIETVQKRFRRPDLDVTHVIPMMYRRTALANEVLSEIQKHFGRKTTQPVPINVAIDEASANGQPVITYAPRSKGAEAFSKIAKKVLSHV